MRVHAPHTQPVKTGKFGPKLDAMDMQNKPFRAALQNGHDLNESYKMPAPNASGTNHSYHHPLGGKAPAHAKDTKNTY